MDTRRYPSIPPKTLAVDISTTDMLFKLTEELDWGGNDLTTADFNTTSVWGTFINDTKTRVEFFTFDPTTIPLATTTGVVILQRGLKYYAEGNTTDIVEVTANKLPWTAGETKVLLGTNPPGMYGTFANKDNDETIFGKWTFPGGGTANAPVSGTVYSAPTDLLEYPPKQYVDDQISMVVSAGLPMFAVLQDGVDPSLNITIGSGEFMLGNQPGFYAGVAGVAMTPSTTNYVMFDPRTNAHFVNTTGFVADKLPLAIVTTDATDITSVVDRRAFLDLPSDDQAITTQYTYGTLIVPGDVLYLDTADAKWKLADASVAATADNTYGVALDAGVNNDTGKRVQISGIVTTVSGITTAGIQYVSNTSGQVSNVVGTYKKVIGFSPDGTTMIMIPVLRVEELAGSNSATTTANLNESMTFFANTAITAAQANILVGGTTSNADSLHTHFGLAGFPANLYYTYTLPYVIVSGVTEGGWEGNNALWFTNAAVAQVTGAVSTLHVVRILGSVSATGYQFTLTPEIRVQVPCKFTNSTSVITGFGFSNNATGPANADVNPADSSTNFAGYSIDITGSVYAKTSDTVGVTTTLIAGVTFTDWNVYEVRFNQVAGQVTFYVNNILKATHTTNTPGAGGGDVDFGYRATTTDSGVFTCAIPTFFHKLS